jgi:hypothetical protein
MTRFYFDTDDGSNSIRDEDGIEANSLEAVRNEAISVLSDFAAEVPIGVNQRVFAVQGRDDVGHPILGATLALNIEWLRPV